MEQRSKQKLPPRRQKALSTEFTARLGEFIRWHRKQAKLTQAGMADLAGIGKTAVFDIEAGKSTVRLETLLNVLRVLNIGVTMHSKLDSIAEDWNENS